MIIDYLNSAVKTRILKLLVKTDASLCFREIASLTESGIRSTQIALKDFEKLKLITKSKQANMTLYKANETPEIIEFRDFLIRDANKKIRTKAKIFSKKTEKILPIIQDLHDVGYFIKSKLQRNG